MDLILSKNPASGEIIHTEKTFDHSKISEVVERAKAAQKTVWGNFSIKSRMKHLEKGRRFLLENIDSIAQSISQNNGKPLVEALAEVVPMIQTISYLSKNAEKILKDEKVPMGFFLPTKKAYLTYRPLGVVGIISPWNYPLSTPFAEVAQNLVAGNAVILKPSEVTGLVNQWIQKIVDKMELPEHVFTMLSGKGDVGAALASSFVDRIMVTGSVNTGRKVMTSAAANLTPVTLELGGKDCMIILDDANIETAASAAVVGGMYNAGQTCCSVERLIIHESIAEEFLNLMKEKLKKIRVGESQDFQNDMGPITFEGQKAVYLNQLKDHIKHKERTVFGDTDFDGKARFMKPLVVQTGDSRDFWKEETFGPVIAIKTFKTDLKAIEINNNSRFGLTALIWSKNTARAREMAKHLNVGTVVINDAPFTNAIPMLPWGGVKESGFGKVHGAQGLRDLSHMRVISYDIAGQQKQFWWYPYSRVQYDFLKNYALLFEGIGFTTKFRAFLNVIKNITKMGPRI